MNGHTAPEGSPELIVTFTGDRYEQRVAGEVNERGTIKLDLSKKPIAVDFVISEGDDAGKTQLGVLEVTGDTMRGCLAEPGSPARPTAFAVKDGVLLFEAKRIQR